MISMGVAVAAVLGLISYQSWTNQQLKNAPLKCLAGAWSTKPKPGCREKLNGELESSFWFLLAFGFLTVISWFEMLILFAGLLKMACYRCCRSSHGDEC
jgi:hypothetical protein